MEHQLFFKNNIAVRGTQFLQTCQGLGKIFERILRIPMDFWTVIFIIKRRFAVMNYKYHITHSLLSMPLGSKGHKLWNKLRKLSQLLIYFCLSAFHHWFAGTELNSWATINSNLMEMKVEFSITKAEFST